jgi:hypothetical protein
MFTHVSNSVHNDVLSLNLAFENIVEILMNLNNSAK